MSSAGKGEGSGSGSDGGEISPEERAAIRQRSNEIGKKLDAVNKRRDAAGEKSRQAAFGHAIEFAAYLVVGVVFGVFLGQFLDTQFGTEPWLLVLFMILGFAAGLLNVIRSAQKAQAENEPLQRAAPSVKDDDDD